MNAGKSGLAVSAVFAGLIAELPPWVVSYAGKLVSVFVLAVVAELGRRLVILIWKEKK